MEKCPTYKRIKINWLLIVIYAIVCVGIHILMKFSYINQWGNNPVTEISLYVVMPSLLAIIFVVSLFCAGRLKLIINDDFVIFRSDGCVFVKISIAWIKSTSVEKAEKIGYSTGKIEKCWVDIFAKNKVCIQLMNRKAVHIFAKDIERIKEEIEKRMSEYQQNG